MVTPCNGDARAHGGSVFPLEISDIDSDLFCFCYRIDY